MQSSGRWQLQLHSGHGHQKIQYGPGPNDYGGYYAFERQDERFAGWRRRVRSDIDWRQDTLARHIRGYQPLAFAPVRHLRAGRHQQPAYPRRPARLADEALRRGRHPRPERPRPPGQQAAAGPHPGHSRHERWRPPLQTPLRRPLTARVTGRRLSPTASTPRPGRATCVARPLDRGRQEHASRRDA